MYKVPLVLWVRYTSFSMQLFQIFQPNLELSIPENNEGRKPWINPTRMSTKITEVCFFFSIHNAEKIKITRHGDSSIVVAVSSVFGSQLGEPLPIPCSSSEALRAEQAHQGDRIRRKMRKIIGRSDLIMATPVKNKRLIGRRAIWWVFKVKCESTHYPFRLAEAAASSQAMAEMASAFVHNVKPWHKAS